MERTCRSELPEASTMQSETSVTRRTSNTLMLTAFMSSRAATTVLTSAARAGGREPFGLMDTGERSLALSIPPCPGQQLADAVRHEIAGIAAARDQLPQLGGGDLQLGHGMH